MNGIIKRHFGKHTTTDTKLRLHDITSKASETTIRTYKIGPPEKA
jgi:hypothetical protein